MSSQIRADDAGVLNFIAVTVQDMGERVKRIENRIENDLATKADIVAVRGDVEQVRLRLDNIDKAMTTRMSELETEISRLRSALYLVAKNQPEVLRLLGK